MEYGHVNTDYVDEQFASVSMREDIDGVKHVVFSPDRQIMNPNDGDEPHTEIVMDVAQARKVARMLNRAARRAKL